MYSTVELFTTIAVVLRNREMWKAWNAPILEGYEYAVLRREDFAKLSPKTGRIFCTFLLPRELIWGFPYARGYDIIYLSGNLSDWQIITSIDMYSTVELFTTIAVVLRNRKMWKVRNAPILVGYEYAVLRRKDFAKLTQKGGRISSTFLLSPELIWGSPYARDLWYHQPSGKLSDWQIITSTPMYNTILLFTIITGVLRNREMWTVQNAPILEGYEYAVLRRKDFAKLTLKAGRVSSTFLLTPELIWGSPYARDLWYHQPSGKLSDWQIITSMYMYSTVELFTTIAVLLSNREMWNVWIATIFEGYEYAVLRRKDFAKLSPKTGRIFCTFLLPRELIWGSLYAKDLWYHLFFMWHIRLTNYNFHSCVPYCITIHYHSSSIEK